MWQLILYIIISHIVSQMFAVISFLNGLLLCMSEGPYTVRENRNPHSYIIEESGIMAFMPNRGVQYKKQTNTSLI